MSLRRMLSDSTNAISGYVHLLNITDMTHRFTTSRGVPQTEGGLKTCLGLKYSVAMNIVRFDKCCLTLCSILEYKRYDALIPDSKTETVMKLLSAT